MEHLTFFVMSWLILLVPGFDDSIPPTGDKTFKIEYSEIVQSIKTTSDETLDFWGFDIELKQNSDAILDIKIPKNFPTPASFTNSWNYGERPMVLVDEVEIDYEVVEDPCYFHYKIPVEGKTSVGIAYPVILTGTWQLYSPRQFDENDQCYNKVFYAQPILSPLQQFKSEIPANEVQCKENLQLVIKYNGLPACVKLETKQKLIQRGWTIEVKLEPEPADKNDFAINEENKVDLSNPKIPKDKEGRIDYDKLVKLISKPYFSKLLTEQNAEHDPEDIVLMIGPRITMYTEYSSACGYVIANDGEDYWLKSFLDYDTLTEAKIMDENPDPCKPNYGSCFCDAQIHKAENTMKELSYLTASEEQTIGKIVQKYLNNTKIANVPDKFVVGKYNFESKPDELTYCGQFIWDAHDIYFEGYIKNTNVVGFGLAFEKPKLCAINDNAQVFYFDKNSIVRDSFEGK